MLISCRGVEQVLRLFTLLTDIVDINCVKANIECDSLNPQII